MLGYRHQDVAVVDVVPWNYVHVYRKGREEKIMRMDVPDEQWRVLDEASTGTYRRPWQGENRLNTTTNKTMVFIRVIIGAANGFVSFVSLVLICGKQMWNVKCVSLSFKVYTLSVI